MTVGTRQPLLGLDTPLLDLDTLLLDPDTLLPTPNLLVPHQAAPMAGRPHSRQPLMVHHTSTEITLLPLSFQEPQEDMVTAAADGRGPSAYFESVECTTPGLPYHTCKVRL